jgi:hypothetical protein
MACTRTDSELGRSVIVDGVIGCVPMKYSIDLSPLRFQFPFVLQLNSKSHISNDSPNVVDIVMRKDFVQSQIRVALDNNINGHQNIVLINRNINKHSRCRRDRYNISSKIITYNILKLLLKKNMAISFFKSSNLFEIFIVNMIANCTRPRSLFCDSENYVAVA